MIGGKKRRRRRSELRLGTQTANFETVPARPKISFGPVLQFWKKRGPKVIAIFLLAAIAWTGYALFSTPSFFVYGAQIKGNEALSDREIYLASQVDRQSIFWINSQKVEAQIAALPNVKSVDVSVALPRQVTIEVVERQPELLWQTGQEIWWIDKEGTVVPPKTEVEKMLKIIDDDMQPLEAGYKIDPTVIKGAQALRLLAPNVSIIRHTRAQGLIVSTPEGWPVFLGDGSEMRAKLVVLSGLLPDLRDEENPPLYIDLRNPLRPVYKLKPEVKPLPALFPRAPLIPTPWQGSRRWPALSPRR
jgi:cell division protein FtsQ